MKVPHGLQPLVEDGVVDTVIRQLQSGKEADVYVVACGEEIRCAKVYKSSELRSFKKVAEYREGRKSRGSRNIRATAKRGRHGRKLKEEEWKTAEIDALYALAAAGVRVPTPHGVHDGVLLMELVQDEDGNPAPRLNEVEISAQQARDWHAFLIAEIVRMLCAGRIHGDLSEFNVLVDPAGPVIIDLPQAVEASSNNNAFRMLDRDVNNMRWTFSRPRPSCSIPNSPGRCGTSTRREICIRIRPSPAATPVAKPMPTWMRCWMRSRTRGARHKRARWEERKPH